MESKEVEKPLWRKISITLTPLQTQLIMIYLERALNGDLDSEAHNALQFLVNKIYTATKKVRSKEGVIE